MMELEPETHKKVLPALKAQTVGFFFWGFFWCFLTPHSLSGTQEDPVAMEAKTLNFFPLWNEYSSLSYTGRSAPLLLLPYTRRHSQTMPDDRLFLFPPLLLFLSSVSNFRSISSASIFQPIVFALSCRALHLVSKRDRPKPPERRTWHQKLHFYWVLSATSNISLVC